MSRIRPLLILAAAVLATGVLSGIAGGLCTVLGRMVADATYGFSGGPLLTGVEHAPAWRRVVGPTLGCALAGAGWWWLRRRAVIPKLTEQIREGHPFEPGPMGIDALLQVLAVGCGASLGREQAPRMMAAVLTQGCLRPGPFTPELRRILMASATGAGLAAVYTVPVAGALFTLGVLRSGRPVAVAVAVATSVIATLTVWPLHHGAPTYPWPATQVTGTAYLFAVVAMPMAALAGLGFNALIAKARPRTPPASRTLIPRIGFAGLVLGVGSIWMPDLPGNGKSIVLETLAGGDTLGLVAVAVVLKPLLTALFLRAGAVGGLLTPALSTGVALGACAALVIQAWGGTASVPALAVIAGAAMVAVTQNAPVFAAVFSVELTRPPLEVAAMLVVAALGAHRLGITISGQRSQDPGTAPP